MTCKYILSGTVVVDLHKLMFDFTSGKDTKKYCDTDCLLSFENLTY